MNTEHEQAEPVVHRVQLNICQPCLDGVGKECHTPGCVFYLHRVDLPIARDLYEIIDAAKQPAEAETETPDEYDRLKAWKDGIVARDEERLRDEGRRSVILIRCTECLDVPQQNKAEFTGAECGGCIAKERDAALAEVERLKEENERLSSRVSKLEVYLESACDRLDHFTGYAEEREILEEKL